MVLAIRGAAKKAWFRSIQEVYCWGENPSLALQTEALHSWTSRKPAQPPVCSFSMACCIMEPDRIRGRRWHRAGGHMEKPTWGFAVSLLKAPLLCAVQSCGIHCWQTVDAHHLLTDSTLWLHTTHHYYMLAASSPMIITGTFFLFSRCSLWKQCFGTLAFKPMTVRPPSQWLTHVEINGHSLPCQVFSI